MFEAKKQVNRNFDHAILVHAAGDKLLQETAYRLKSAVFCNNTGCRLRGDKFLLLLNNLHKRENVAVVLDKVLVIIQLPVELEISQPHVSARISDSLSLTREFFAMPYKILTISRSILFGHYLR